MHSHGVPSVPIFVTVGRLGRSLGFLGFSSRDILDRASDGVSEPEASSECDDALEDWCVADGGLVNTD